MSLRGAKRRGNLPEGNPYKSDDAMFLPLAKAMHLRRDVYLWHVADLNLSLRGE